MTVTRLNPEYTPPLPTVSGWYFGLNVSGWGFVVPLASVRSAASVSVSSAQVWTPSGGWANLSYSGAQTNGGHIVLLFDSANTGVESNKVYLVSITATIS